VCHHRGVQPAPLRQALIVVPPEGCAVTVSPIADYEPSTCPRPRPARHLVAVREPGSSDRLRSAAVFADAALRVILEVIDRRRNRNNCGCC
jgi:hypothetical protein